MNFIEITTVVVACWAPVFMIIGYYVGMLDERKAWNKLIAEGKIPAPRGTPNV